MKTLVVLVALVFSASAYAGQLKDFSNISVKKLDRMAKYELDRKDKIWFTGAEKGLHGIPSWSPALCTDGKFIYGPNKTVKYCDDDNNNCTEYDVTLKQPIYGTRYQYICSGSDDNENCVKNKVKYTQLPTRNIPVLLQQNDDDADDVVVGYKAFTIKSCGMGSAPAN